MSYQQPPQGYPPQQGYPQQPQQGYPPQAAYPQQGQRPGGGVGGIGEGREGEESGEGEQAHWRFSFSKDAKKRNPRPTARPGIPLVPAKECTPARRPLSQSWLVQIVGRD